jgi:hypothetical protein
LAWPGTAWLGRAGHGEVHGEARRGGAGQGEAWHGEVHGACRNGSERGTKNKKEEVGAMGTKCKPHPGVPYFRGLPTKPDVDRLISVFDLREGMEIQIEDIEKELGVDRKSHRYSSIVTAWRKWMYREKNLDMQGTGEGSYRINNPNERILHASSYVSRGRKSINKGIALAYSTDAKRLSSEYVERRNLISSLNLRKIEMSSSVFK